MLVNNNLIGFGARGSGGGSALLYEIIQELGLNSNLNLCLDAADTRSYDGTSQTWTDIVAGNNFFRGADGSATATDPTFNGTAGLATEATYFSLDGGDYFTETAAHTFADGWHKNNGAFTLACVIYSPGGMNNTIFSNTPAAGLADGINFGPINGTELNLAHATSNTTQETLLHSSNLSSSSWNFCAAAYDEAAPSVAFRLNGTTSAPAAAASTTTDNNSQPMRLCAYGDASAPLVSGTRLACFGAWSRALSATELGNLYTLLKARRFTSLP